MIEVTDFQKIGIFLTAIGSAFIFLGCLLLFDRGLLAIGNILFLSGLGFIMGAKRLQLFFFQRHKWKGSAFFFAGFFIVLWGWPLVGMFVEGYGFFQLFGGFIPAALSFLNRIPFLGMILSLPGISWVVQKLGGDVSRSMV